MYLAALEEREHFEGFAALLVDRAEDCEGDEHFVSVQAGVMSAEPVELHLLYGLDHGLGDKLDVVVYTGEVFGGVEYEGGAWSEQVARLCENDSAVGELEGRARDSGLPGIFTGGGDTFPVIDIDFSLIEEEGYLIDLAVAGIADGKLIECGEISPYYFIFGCLGAYIVIRDAEAYHVDTHVGG